MQPKDSPAYKLFSGTSDGFLTGYTNFQNVKMMEEFKRIPDWTNEAFAAAGSRSVGGSTATAVVTSGASGSAVLNGAKISDAAVLRRVVPELEEGEARRLLLLNGNNLKAAMRMVLQDQTPSPKL